jgi:hypothetical protein
MARASGWGGPWVTLMLAAGMTWAAPAPVSAQHPSAGARAAKPLPRTLRDGAPQQRFPTNASKRPATQAPPRATPAPSITIDPRDLVGRIAPERRSAALLQREIQVLERLLQNSQRGDRRRPDVLLRLSHALQELMWLQRVRLHQLQDAHGRDCRCAGGAAEAIASAERPLPERALAAR